MSNNTKAAWRYDQSSGELFYKGKLYSRGYSGKGRGKNNPSMQNVPGTGPIPAGLWEMTDIYDSQNVGPRTVRLFAVDGTRDDKHDATGRSAFRIHGDKARAPGTASRGCIILPRAVREFMWRSGDRLIEVVA